MSLLVQLALMILPWSLRRPLLRSFLGYQIDPTARIGYSVVAASKLVMGADARIGSLTFVKGLEELVLEEGAILGNLNWVTGLPRTSQYFHDQLDRRPALFIRRHAAVTHRHLLDCTDTIEVGAFATFGGWGSQILTHSIDVEDCRQRCAPVRIGEYAFIGTRSVFLKGSSLPGFSILAAGSVLGGKYDEAYQLYSGVPAKPVKALSPDLAYFTRTQGPVV